VHWRSPGAAAAFIQSGMEKSISKVQTFSALDLGADVSRAPDAATVGAFIADVVAQFNAAPATTPLDAFGWPTAKAKMDILGEQYFVAMFGGAADGFNFIRRTGFPRTMSRSLEGSPGVFPRSLLYASDETIANQNFYH